MQTHQFEKCKEIFALLSEYLDLELPSDACLEIAAHLEGCQPCVEFANSLRKTVELCRQYEPSEIPAPLSSDTKAELIRAYERMLATRDTPQRG